MALSQGLHQKLLQKLSPQQIQLMKLLQVPTASLEERIKEELEENPALELAEPGNAEDTFEDAFESAEDTDTETSDDMEPDMLDMSDYIHEDDDEVGDYRLRDDHYPGPGERTAQPVKT